MQARWISRLQTELYVFSTVHACEMSGHSTVSITPLFQRADLEQDEEYPSLTLG
jgi:hypothetical protein